MRRSIKAHRQQAGLSQGDLAKKLRTSQVTVSGWETGKHSPSATNLQHLANALGVDMSEIAFGGELIAVSRAHIRSVLQAELDSGTNPGIWRTDAGIFIRPAFKQVVQATAGYRRAFEDYVLDVSEPSDVPIGSLRRGARLEMVRVIASATELPA